MGAFASCLWVFVLLERHQESALQMDQDCDARTLLQLKLASYIYNNGGNLSIALATTDGAAATALQSLVTPSEGCGCISGKQMEELENTIISYKGLIIEWAQKERKSFEFCLINQWGKQHNMTFEMGLHIDQNLIAKGKGTSKKRAEEDAAKKAFSTLDIHI